MSRETLDGAYGRGSFLNIFKGKIEMEKNSGHKKELELQVTDVHGKIWLTHIARVIEPKKPLSARAMRNEFLKTPDKDGLVHNMEYADARQTACHPQVARLYVAHRDAGRCS